MVDSLCSLRFFIVCIFLFVVTAFSFLHKNGCSNISCTASSVVVNSCSYCLSGNLFVFPCILNNDTVWYNILDCGLLSFSTLNIFATPFWGVNLLLRNQLIAWGNFPCTWPVHFLFAAFQIDSLSLTFAILIIIYLGVGCFGFISFETICTS